MFETRIDQLVYDFNCRPLTYVDASWLAPEAAATIDRLRDSPDPQARSLANDWLMQHFALARDSADFDFEFAEPAKRLLLLDPRALCELALWVGVAGFAHELRKWVTREQRLLLKRALGEQDQRFFMQHVLRWPVLRQLALPEARLLDSEAAALRQRAEQSGAALLLSAIGSPDEPAVRRATLKLPKNWQAWTRGADVTSESSQQVVAFVLGCVLRERSTEWHWLF
jgi:YOP proteins translocation protein K (YscK)